jgi:hypothetical protein
VAIALNAAGPAGVCTAAVSWMSARTRVAPPAKARQVTVAVGRQEPHPCTERVAIVPCGPDAAALFSETRFSLSRDSCGLGNWRSNLPFSVCIELGAHASRREQGSWAVEGRKKVPDTAPLAGSILSAAQEGGAGSICPRGGTSRRVSAGQEGRSHLWQICPGEI